MADGSILNQIGYNRMTADEFTKRTQKSDLRVEACPVLAFRRGQHRPRAALAM